MIIYEALHICKGYFHSNFVLLSPPSRSDFTTFPIFRNQPEANGVLTDRIVETFHRGRHGGIEDSDQ